MNNRPALTDSHCFDGRIQHRIDQPSIGAGAKRPTYNQTIETIDYWREVHLASGDLKLRDVRQPLFIWNGSLEIPIDDIFWSRADLTKV